MPRNNVVRLFDQERKRRERIIAAWADTPKRKLARQRNWCYYVLAGFEAVAASTLRPFMSKASYESLVRAIASARYAVDAGYYDKMDALERRRK
jgi:hypothetical protein